MNIVCIIPARMGSSRFPGKPLMEIAGKAMIKICYENAVNSSAYSKVVVATCDNEIKDFCISNDMDFEMTSNSHERCSSRCLEALLSLENNGENYDAVLMLQGDEPLISPAMLKKSAESLQNGDTEVTNLMTEITNIDEYNDINEVKVVTDNNSNAIYFSRAPIPATKDEISFKIFKQVCAIGFTRHSLIAFEDFSESSLEIIESVDMLRFIQNGIKIKMIEVSGNIVSVDTPSDLIKAESFFK